MQFLSVCFCKNESWPDRAIELPCPESDLIQWLTLDFEFNSRSCSSLLRTNPALLLLALSTFAKQRFRAPKTNQELLDFLKSTSQAANSNNQSLASRVNVIELNAEPAELDAKLVEAVGEFWAADSNEKTRNRIYKFLNRIVRSEFSKETRPSKKATRELVDALIGESFSLAEFKPLRERHWSQSVCIDRWAEVGSGTAEQQLIFKLLSNQSRLVADFDEQLHVDKLAAMKQLAYGASHEINNPLANISTRAQALLTEERHPDKRFRLAVIYEQAMRAHEMISDMMLFANPPKISRTTTDLRGIVRKVVSELKSSFDDQGVELVVRIGSNLEMVDVDSNQFAVLLSALLRNSRESILHDQGEIELHISRKCKSENDVLRVSVTDNGEGVDDRVRPHLFDPFFSGREAGRGLGFGLSKAYRIAELHGGKVFLESSRPGKATTFVVEIPDVIC